MISRGYVRYIHATTASAGAGATTTQLRPGEGKEWRILYAVGLQDDGARSANWYATDPAGSGALGPDVTLNANTVFALGAAASAAAPLVLGPLKATRAHYYSFLFDASAVAKNGHIYAIVEEFTGVYNA